MSIDLQQYARPYATAAFAWAKAHQQEQAWQEVFNHLADVFRDASVHALLNDPRVSEPQLAEVVLAALGDNAGQAQQNFLRLLAEKRRLHLVPSIAAAYQALLRQANHRLQAYVRTAVPLSAPDEQRLQAKLAQKYGKTIELQWCQDTALIGGMQIHIGDEVIDASIRGKLHQLAEQLVL